MHEQGPKKGKEIALYSSARAHGRVRNLEYERTAMNDFMRSVKHCTQVLIVSAHCVDRSYRYMSADSDVLKDFRFRSNFGHETFQGSHGSLSCS